MKMEIIQPFMDAADAVLGHNLRCPTRMDDLRMDAWHLRRQGIAAVVSLQGDIEGRIVLDLSPETACKMAKEFAQGEADVAPLAQDIVCELANQVIGNAVTALNDCGYRFRVQPPEISTADPIPSSANTEALLMIFDTESGPVFLNIALRAAKAYAAD